MALVSQIHDAASALDIDALKPEQEQAIRQFLQGRDVFVALPTLGYGKSMKSLCDFALPPVFDRIRKVTNQSIVLVVSPLVALMKDQVAHCSSRGLTAGFICNEERNTGG